MSTPKLSFFTQWDCFLKQSKQLKLSVTSRDCYMCLLHRWNKKFFANPIIISVRELNRQYGISKNYGKKYLKELSKHNLITICENGQKILVTIKELSNGKENSQRITSLNEDMNCTETGTGTVPKSGQYNKTSINKNIIYRNINSRSNGKQDLPAVLNYVQQSCLPSGNQLRPSFDEVLRVFQKAGYSLDSAKSFWEYNNRKGHAFSDPKKSWNDYAIQFMKRIKIRIIEPNIIIDPGTPSVEPVSQEILEKAILIRVSNLMCSNERQMCLLAEAYRNRQYDDPLVIKDTPQLNHIIKSLISTKISESQ